jgi:hypothetical protein
MRPLQLLNCIFGNHHRDGRKVARDKDGHTYRSVCVGCGRRMIQVAGEWRLEKKSERDGR